MASFKITFTKTALNNIKLPENNIRDLYYDLEEKGLILMVYKTGSKTYYLYKKIEGQPEFIKLGTYDSIDIQTARQLANSHKSDISKGLNPNQEKRKLKDETTFKEAFSDFLTNHSKMHKKTWKEDERYYEKHLTDWNNKRISDITPDIVQTKHTKLGTENGKYLANRVKSTISEIFNYLIKVKGFKGTNPCPAIQNFKEFKRKRFLLPEELPSFVEAVQKEESESVRDYFILSLLLGARKSDMFSMAWNDINFNNAQWTIKDSKNGEDLTVVINDLAMEILIKRKDNHQALIESIFNELGAHSTLLKTRLSQFVFPSIRSVTGHMINPNKALKRILIRSDIQDIRIHDLRRTFGSYQAINNSSMLIIGKSLGHKNIASTEVYARLNIDPVRESVNAASTLMMNIATRKSG